MAQYDGSIRIKTEVSTQGLKDGENEIKKSLVGLGDSMKFALQSIKDSPKIAKIAFSSLSSVIQKTITGTKDLSTNTQDAATKQSQASQKASAALAEQEKKVSALKQKMIEYGNAKIPTQEYVQAEKEIDKINKRLDAAVEKQIKFMETGGKQKSQAFKNMEYDIERLREQLEEAIIKKSQLEQSGRGHISGIDTEEFTKMSQQYEIAAQKLEELRQREASAAEESRRLAEIGKNAKVSNPFIIKLRSEIERLTERQKLLGRAGVGGAGFKEWEKNAQIIQRLNAVLKRYQNGADKAKKSTKKMNSEVKNTSKSVKKSNDSFFSHIKTILKYTIGIRSMYILFNRLRSGLKEGLQNLAQYSDDTNQAISLLMSRMTQLKNAFATAFSPLVEVAAPYLARFISLLAEAATWTSQLFAALMGKDTFIKASQVQQDYADSLDKSKDSTEDLKKATEKALAPFDEIIQLQKSQTKTDKDKNDTELKPEEMFETVQVSNQMKVLAEDIKKTFDGLFNPIKKSWEDNGPAVLESMKNVFASAKKLASDVGASFMQVWNVEGYGKKITDDLLITFANLAQTVANLITQFDKAWNSGNTGTNILRHLGDIILEITGFFRQASESLKNWAANLDFSPLLKAFDGVLVAIKPIVASVGNLLLWLLNNVLLPIAKWGIEQALPSVFNLIAAALKVLNSVIQELKPFALWLWENFLQPIGKWTGSIIIAAIQKIVEWLTKFSNWISQHKEAVQNITIVILSFFAAWKFTQFVTGISQIITSLGGFMGIAGNVIKILSSTIMTISPLTLALTGIISVIAILAKNWSKMSPTEKVISSILAAAAAVGVLAVALGAVKGAAGAALVAAALVAGIAAATIAINAGKRQVSSFQSSGNIGRSAMERNLYPTVASYPIPYLATGAVIPPNHEFLAVLGDQKRGTNIEAPISTIKQAVREVLAEEDGSKNNKTSTPIFLEMDGKIFARLFAPYLDTEKSRIGVRMVNA